MLLKQRITHVLVGLMTSVAFFGIAASASAGTYTVTSCRASMSESIQGWTHSSTAGSIGGVPYFYDAGSCEPAGNGLYRKFEVNGVAPGASDSWDFIAPADTRIASVDIHQLATARVANSIAGIWAVRADGSSSALDLAVGDGGAGNSFGDAVYGFQPNSQVYALHSIIGCLDTGSCNGWAAGGLPGAEYTLGAATITLSDVSDPTISSASGAGWQTTPPDDVSPITYSAADAGGGIKQVDLLVDGAVLQTNASTCVAGDRLPCPRTIGGSFSLDTRELSEGTHTVGLVAKDVAGNASGPHSQELVITVRRPPAPNGTSPVSTSDATTSADGAPAVGDNLHGNPGSWTGTDITYVYQWMRCDPTGAGCVTIPGATGLDYAPTAADVGHTLVFCVTATNSGGSATSCSPATGVVLAQHTTSGSVPPSTGTPAGNGPGDGRAGTTDSSNGSDRGATNGSPASDRAVLTVVTTNRSRTQKVRFGKRVPISGRLVGPEGTPIGGAILTVETQTAVPGAAMAEAARVVTARDGKFTYVAPPGPSRTIRLGYRAYSRDASFADTTDVRLVVAAGLTLKASRTKVRNREATTFGGRLLGRPVPKKGVVVDLQVLFRNKWRTFAAPRTNRKGTYHYKYRFMAGAANWKFRARVRADSSYPYALGQTRKPVSVRVR